MQTLLVDGNTRGLCAVQWIRRANQHGPTPTLKVEADLADGTIWQSIVPMDAVVLEGPGSKPVALGALVAPLKKEMKEDVERIWVSVTARDLDGE